MYSNEIKKLITNSKFGKCLASITNSNKIQIWHSQSVWKPTGRQKVVGIETYNIGHFGGRCLYSMDSTNRC